VSRRSPTPPEGQITLRYTDHGVTITAIIPGYAGHVIGRATLPEALLALADALNAADARRAAPVGVA
jgi:hypothetical protein